MSDASASSASAVACCASPSSSVSGIGWCACTRARHNMLRRVVGCATAYSMHVRERVCGWVAVCARAAVALAHNKIPSFLHVGIHYVSLGRRLLARSPIFHARHTLIALSYVPCNGRIYKQDWFTETWITFATVQ